MSAGAIVAALAMLEHPSAARLAQPVSLPKGVTFLLEVAAGRRTPFAKQARSRGVRKRFCKWQRPFLSSRSPAAWRG